MLGECVINLIVWLITTVNTTENQSVHFHIKNVPAQKP